MLTNEQIVEILKTAADYIDEHGWLHFLPARYAPPYLSGGPGPVSALGAIQYLITGSPVRWGTPDGDPRLDDVDQVMECLNKRFIRLHPDDLATLSPDPFMTWHSEGGYPGFRRRRDEAEVLAFLRLMVEELSSSTAGRGDEIGGGR